MLLLTNIDIEVQTPTNHFSFTFHTPRFDSTLLHCAKPNDISLRSANIALDIPDNDQKNTRNVSQVRVNLP